MQIEEVALEILNAWDIGQSVEPFSAREAISMTDAYSVTRALHKQRVARGEHHVGRKIGFTNTTLWKRYGVDGPIWGDMWDRTVFDIADARVFDLGTLIEPRIEPEIVFHLSASPQPGMATDDLLGCCDWIAHGVEIVQSPYPGWQFEAPDTVIAGGLHGALLIGERRPTAALRAADLIDFSCALSCDGKERDTGTGSLVLGGPLLALGHLVKTLAGDSLNPNLRAGEIITTGTLTDAHPVAAGETWSTSLSGIALPDLAVAFE